jgi:hypothetical protein
MIKLTCSKLLRIFGDNPTTKPEGEGSAGVEEDEGEV